MAGVILLDTQPNTTNTYTLPVTQVSNSNATEIKGFKEALKTREENKVSQSIISAHVFSMLSGCMMQTVC